MKGNIKLILAILVFCAIIQMEAIKLAYCPNYTTLTGEWDGANELVMNFYAFIIAGCAVMNLLKTIHPITNYFIYSIIGLIAFNVLDRMFRHYELDEVDLVFKIPITLILSGLYYAKRHRKEIID